MKNQFINVSNAEMNALSMSELEMINGGSAGGKIAAGVACLVVAGAIEYFSGGAATALAADVAYGGLGLIGSGISSW